MIWDTATKAYTEGPSMATGRADACGAAVEGKLYVAGGYTTNFESTLQSVEVFDSVSGEWSEGPPLPEPRYDGAHSLPCCKLCSKWLTCHSALQSHETCTLLKDAARRGCAS